MRIGFKSLSHDGDFLAVTLVSFTFLIILSFTYCFPLKCVDWFHEISFSRSTYVILNTLNPANIKTDRRAVNTTMNAPERSSAFLLDEDAGEVKIEYAPDTKVSNSGTFVFNKEDHTVGNLLRMQLLRDPKVRFAGYMLPHPLTNCLRLKLQTTSSTTAPIEALSAAIEDLQNETDHLTTRESY